MNYESDELQIRVHRLLFNTVYSLSSEQTII
jgi:hypothetical protein